MASTVGALGLRLGEINIQHVRWFPSRDAGGEEPNGPSENRPAAVKAQICEQKYAFLARVGVFLMKWTSLQTASLFGLVS